MINLKRLHSDMSLNIQIQDQNHELHPRQPNKRAKRLFKVLDDEKSDRIVNAVKGTKTDVRNQVTSDQICEGRKTVDYSSLESVKKELDRSFEIIISSNQIPMPRSSLSRILLQTNERKSVDAQKSPLAFTPKLSPDRPKRSRNGART